MALLLPSHGRNKLRRPDARQGREVPAVHLFEFKVCTLFVQFLPVTLKTNKLASM